jgi:catechol 2,3-dioxygenase-like lactoylglutathione lyase family enzyme
MIDYQRIYHTGIRVPDLDAAMIELSATLGVTWATPMSSPAQPAWTPEHGQQYLPLRFTYSCEGSQHIELLEGPPGSIWDGRERPGVHHVGLWVDDVAAETRRAVENGWVCRLAQVSPDEGYGTYSYVEPPGSAMLVEFVASTALPRFERWWAGGSL